MIFLIEYDRQTGKILAQASFSDSLRAEAESSRLALELRNLGKGLNHEIVLLDASSEDSLRLTHRRYFESLEELAQPPLGFAN
jgi:hypothetical protein